MNAVQMSTAEISNVSGGDRVVWRLTKDGIVYTYDGPNLAYMPLTSGTWFNTFQDPTLQFLTTDVNVNSWLLQRAYSKMSSAEFDFGVTVGEVAETAAFLAGPLRGIATLSASAFAGARAILKDGPRTAVMVAKNATSRQARRLMQTTKQHPLHAGLRIIDETANHWLAYKFGVLPLIDDVGKALDFKDQNVAQKFGLQHARVKGPKRDTTAVDVVMNNKSLGGGAIFFDCMQTKRTEDRHYCGLYFRHKCDAPLINFMESIGFAPWQLPSLAYELIPLSFVVDRFLDIKSFVRGNIGSLSKDTFGSWHTRQETVTTASTLTNVRFGSSGDAYRVKDLGPQRAQFQMRRVCRILNQQRPNFPVVNPYWRDQLTADMTNLSLIWGRLRSFVGKI